jgi:hypothetical protein
MASPHWVSWQVYHKFQGSFLKKSGNIIILPSSKINPFFPHHCLHCRILSRRSLKTPRLALAWQDWEKRKLAEHRQWITPAAD